MGGFNCPTQLFSLLLTVFHSLLTKVQLEKKSSPSRTVQWNASLVCGMCFQEAHTHICWLVFLWVCVSVLCVMEIIFNSNIYI